MLRRRMGFGSVVALLSVFAFSCGSGKGVTAGGGGGTCETSSDCGTGQRCVDGLCVASTAPEGGVGVDGGGACLDGDGDGFGVGCARGPDCDDSSRTQTGIEVCDGLDNDCDGMVDEGVGSAFCDCSSGCVESGIGPGGAPGGETFMPSDGRSEGVGVDPMGGLVLDSSSVNTNIIWVANTGASTVSKVDTRTYELLATYRTGPDGSNHDPSRSSVNTLGDVFIGNRGGQSLVKISVLGAECPDTNGDGVITTSTGATVLPWGQDDCILWRTELAGRGIIRSVAAQDVVGPDGEVRPYVWVGGWDGFVWKLDGNTGAILVDATPSPAPPYGFALDGLGNLWISGNPTTLGRIDTNRCVDTASCMSDVCVDEAGDACIKQRINLPSGARTYGITVDNRQRVWLGGTVARYDPSAAWADRWVSLGLGAFIHGISADTEGWVWGAGYGSGVLRVNADDPTQNTFVEGTGRSVKGMAVDSDGKVWGINRDHEDATVVTPGPGLMDATVEVVANFFTAPYTYSDMTGSQLRNATRPRGWYRHTFSGCEGAMQPTVWQDLFWDATLPPRTSLLFRARTGDTRAELDAAAWIIIANAPPDMPPASLEEAFMSAGVEHGQLIEIEVQLTSEVTASATPVTPIVHGFTATHLCPPQLM